MRRRYGDTITQVVHPIQVDPSCACGFSRCDPGSPYCEVTRLAGANAVASGQTQPAERSLSEQYLEEFDRVAEWHRSEAKRRAGGVGSATADTTRGEGIERAPKGPPVSPRKKRRTKIEMQEFRADKARQIEASYRELVPEGHWLDEPDESMDQLLETLRDSET